MAPDERNTDEQLSDAELTGTAVFDATGEKSAMPSWDELVREHGDRVYRLAYRLSGDAQDAEDLTQDTFIACSVRCPTTSPARSRLAAPHHHQPLPRHGPPS